MSWEGRRMIEKILENTVRDILVMIRHNYATEICMTRGQEGHVVGWQSKTGSKGQRMLDTLLVELKNPAFLANNTRCLRKDGTRKLPD